MTRRSPAEVLRDGAAIDRAIVAARRRVILEHRMRKIPLVIWQDGQVVEVDPETVELPSLDAADGSRDGKSSNRPKASTGR